MFNVICFSSLLLRRMNRIQCFERYHAAVQEHDFRGVVATDPELYRLYQRRNSFGIKPNQKLHRIFQRRYYEEDVADGYLTLPRASATIWDDELENPLSDVTVLDSVTGKQVLLGSLVRSFFAMCWSKRDKPKQSDWDAFSHGKQAMRITTTAEKLLNRTMDVSDAYYMLRSWLIEVDYKSPCFILQMQKPEEALRKMESNGALLALSSAVVQTKHSGEDEIRYLFDNGFNTNLPGVVELNADLIRIPFEWNNFVDSEQAYP
jgi:hypothetical protein